jgi:hypothetical protein
MGPISDFERLRILTGMNYVARCVHVAAEIRLADALGDMPTPVTTLAKITGTNADALDRVVRVLAAHGVFSMVDRVVSHTEMSRLMRSDHPQSLRDFVRMIGLGVNWRAAERLEHSVRTGEAAMLQNVPGGVWSHYAEHPDEGRIFDASMASRARLMIPAIRSGYDFSRFRTLVDVGGGTGHLLNAVLDDAPDTRGILFDLPHVVDAARSTSSHPRLSFHGGDFFSDRLPTADGYILMEVLHDWPDQAAATILAAVRHSAPRDATLLVLEIEPTDQPGPGWAKTLDIVMLAHFGGKQRTRAEYELLLNRHSFELLRVIETPAGLSIFEAVAR